MYQVLSNLVPVRCYSCKIGTMNICKIGSHKATSKMRDGVCDMHYKRMRKTGTYEYISNRQLRIHKLSNINKEFKTAHCAECGPDIPIYIFPDRVSSYACVEGQRESRLKSRYNIDQEEYDTLMYNQEGKCAICNIILADSVRLKTHLDHDHTCCPEHNKSCGKCVRGILCQACNRGLGCFKDNIEVLKTAINYLKHYSS